MRAWRASAGYAGCTLLSRLASARCDTSKGLTGYGRGGTTIGKRSPILRDMPMLEPFPGPCPKSRDGASVIELVPASLRGAMYSGIDDGATIHCLLGTASGLLGWWSRITGVGAAGVKDAGAEIPSQRTCGGPPTQINETASSKLKARVCMVKDASVLHPRWAEWSQLLSSVPNIITCPPERARYPYRHRACRFDPA